MITTVAFADISHGDKVTVRNGIIGMQIKKQATGMSDSLRYY
jgi:hypothetical protein